MLYRTYIRPHLEFANSAWSPFLRRDITVLEKVQRRATRLPKRLKGVEYGERLDGRAILQNSTYKRVHIGYFLDFFDEFFPSKNREKKFLETAYRCCTKAEKRLLVLHLTLKKFIGAGGYPKHGKLLIGATAPNM